MWCNCLCLLINDSPKLYGVGNNVISVKLAVWTLMEWVTQLRALCFTGVIWANALFINRLIVVGFYESYYKRHDNIDWAVQMNNYSLTINIQNNSIDTKYTSSIFRFQNIVLVGSLVFKSNKEVTCTIMSFGSLWLYYVISQRKVK